ncbi:MAG: hypothetical protein FD165_1541 [Gammaproteobacteria bacterium]|nr:MAG: hypothetical protein FD165_1541 [Gammaproteobacteria bacterium]TND02448.1 MAG: hypothetical protein FD120_2189 [Gammaproteobacteria bacterium]
MKKCVEVVLGDVDESAILALDVTDAKGVCLMPAGTMLGEKTLKRLASRGVKKVSIYREETSTPEEQEKKRQEVARQLDERFRKVANDLLMEQLKAVLLEYRLNNI